MTKVLLVEDDKSLREIYAVRLVEEGYDIVSAGDGEEALAMAIKDRPNLIISDVMMPKISGFDMLDILRSTTETRDIKVIMMTALSSEDQRLRGVSLGADRYLVKSQVGIEDVVRTVHEVLGDAPVAGQTPLMSSAAAAAPRPVAPAGPAIVAGPGAQGPAPISPAAPVTASPPAPVSPAPGMPARVAAPVYSVTPTPAPTPPAPQPLTTAISSPSQGPVSAPTPAAPVPGSTNASSGSVLPQPTAPFSTPRTTSTTLANRVIEPLPATSSAPATSMSTLMEKELGVAPAAAPISSAPQDAPVSFSAIPTPPVPPVPPVPATSFASNPAPDLNFEETPRPTSSAPAPFTVEPQAPTAPTFQPPVNPSAS